MAIKSLWAKISGWRKEKKPDRELFDSLQSDGFLDKKQNPGKSNNNDADASPDNSHINSETSLLDERAKKTGTISTRFDAIERKDKFEKLNEGFNRLIDKLEGINDNLSAQVEQNDRLMYRIDNLPNMFANLPQTVESQKALVDELVEQLKVRQLREQQFIEAVERIPSETAKQSSMLTEMTHKMTVSANADTQMLESFNRFNVSVNSLNRSAEIRAEQLEKLTQTFETSERQTKDIIEKQNKRLSRLLTFLTVTCIVSFALAAGAIALYLL
jgi:methyl-accepting chemotaxis protein